VLVVTTPELPSLRATRSFLELADAAADQSNKWQLIMSSYQGKKVLRIEDIEASIHYRVKATIAEDIAAVSTCINRGTPLILSHRKSPVAQDILALAKQLAEATAKSRRPQGAPSAVSQHVALEEAIGHSEPGKGSSFWHSFTNSARIPAG
jgi:Flp pilus assembly CpaE family ATPase